ncbi:MAG: pantoate--beta-alanine ligase [Planctomycetes bacterium]|nr:pantoate--beta-alanine ligase [Planctomycetota bacterium]
MQQRWADRDEVDVYLGVGANEGDREAAIRTAIAALAVTPGIAVVRVSRLRETEPVGGPPQGRYLNGAVHLRTALAPHALLELCKALERAAGRRFDGVRNGPRPLDLDLLLYGDRELDTRDLTLPHPRLAEREFVLAPLRDLGVDVAVIPRPVAGPRVFEEPDAFAAWCDARRRGGCELGLVPTMGALHDGHASLMRRARAECERVAVTIFVNPLQFGAHEDLDRYPRTFAADLELCRQAGVDAVFAPRVDAMYPPGFCSRVAVGREAETMEGADRPGHFAGVATVVARLWSLARPDRSYYGRKDAQQVAVLRRLQRDLGLSGALVECGIVREPDGLAMSSRNRYLAPADRRAATVLHRSLRAARDAFAGGQHDRDALLAVARAVLDAEPRGRLDYLELRDEGDLAPLPAGRVPRGRMLCAVRFGEPPTRLLDNLSLRGADEEEPW